MYVPETNPTTLAEMKTFLDPLVTAGFFDAITYDDPDTPTKLVCTQDSNTILEIANGSTSASFNVTPYVAEGTAANSSRCVTNKPVSFCFRAAGGAYLLFGQASNARDAFVIAKTAENKTAFVASQVPMNFNFQSTLVTHYVVAFGDDTSNYIYTNGYKVTQNGTTDRTILTMLPVVGSFGGADYFSTVYARSSVQFVEPGVQAIGEQKFACAYNHALTDA